MISKKNIVEEKIIHFSEIEGELSDLISTLSEIQYDFEEVGCEDIKVEINYLSVEENLIPNYILIKGIRKETDYEFKKRIERNEKAYLYRKKRKEKKKKENEIEEYQNYLKLKDKYEDL